MERDGSRYFSARSTVSFIREAALDHDGVRSLAGDCCEGAIQLVAAANDDLMDFKAHIWGALLNLLEKGLHERIVGIAQNAHAARPRYDLGDQFEALCRRLGGGGGQSGEIAVRPRKVADQPRRDWIACHHDDGNVAGRILCRMGGRGLYRDDDIDLAANQFRRQFGEASDLALRRSDLDLDILPLDIAKIAERLAKWPHGFWATDDEARRCAASARLLRTRRERPRGGCATEQRDELAAFHHEELPPRGRRMPNSFGLETKFSIFAAGARRQRAGILDDSKAWKDITPQREKAIKTIRRYIVEAQN